MGFTQVTPWGHMTCFMSFDWLRDRAQLTRMRQLMDFHTITHHESWVAWRKSMSHAGLGLREEPLYEGTLGAWDLGSSCNHLSSFIYYTLNTKIFIYHDFGNQDTTVLYEPSDRRCWIEVNGLSYRNRYWAGNKWSLGNYRLPAACITRRGEDCNTSLQYTYPTNANVIISLH